MNLFRLIYNYITGKIVYVVFSHTTKLGREQCFVAIYASREEAKDFVRKQDENTGWYSIESHTIR